jgi:hypothetical protein
VLQGPVQLDERSGSQPGIAALMPREDSYRRSHAVAGELFFLMEVADTSLSLDRDVKA